MCSQTEQKTHGYRRVSALERTSSSFVDNEPNKTIHLGGITTGPLASTKATTWYESIYINDISKTHVEELRSKEAVASVENIELLKSKVAQPETELERQ